MADKQDRLTVSVEQLTLSNSLPRLLALAMSQMTSLQAIPTNLRIGLAVGMTGMLASLMLNLVAMFRLLRAQQGNKRELAKLGIW